MFGEQKNKEKNIEEEKAKQRRQTRIKSGGLFYEHGMKIEKKYKL